MRFRKLRIAWSVGWGIACVLLIVLWVRSFSALDSLHVPYRPNAWIHVQSFDGRIIVFDGTRRPLRPVPWIGSVPANRHNLSQALSYAIIGNSSMSAAFSVTNRLAVIPHWIVIVFLIAIGGLAWLPTYRFSLRTLLITTTLVAVVLGLIVYATRAS